MFDVDKTQKALEDLKKAQELARQTYITVKNAVSAGKTIASYNVNSLIPESVVSDLQGVLGVFESAIGQIEAQYPSVLTGLYSVPLSNPPVEPVEPTPEEPVDPVEPTEGQV
jgi:hypothetical protein